MNNLKYSYDDVSIVPEVVTDIISRSECGILDENNKMPIFASPMDTVVCEKNIPRFLRNSINVVIPRDIITKDDVITTNLDYRLELGQKYNCFVAISMQEAKEHFILNNESVQYKKYKICIDIANGHMKKVIELIKSIKDEYGNRITIMGGNIANPQTYVEYENAGCDYVRCGIGGGSGCLTSSNTSIYYPYFSLMEEIYKIKREINGRCKIIADGNIRGYRDIQKALVFADYVMIGGLFNKMIESAGKTTYGKCYWVLRGYKIFRPLKTLLCYGKRVDQFNPKIKKMWEDGKIVLWKQFYGMSTKVAQKAMNPDIAKLKTSEGILRYQKVENTLDGWVENECDYLKSAMSYTNSRNLEEYKGCEYVPMLSIRYNK